MGFFGNLFGGNAEKPSEKPKAEGLSEEKEKEWFEKGEQTREETGKKVDTEEKEWFKQGEEKKE